MEGELKKIWQSSPEIEQVKFEKSRFMMDVQSNLDRMHRALKWMYIRESVAAFIVAPIFIAYIFILPNLVMQISSGLISLWAVFVLVVMQRVKKQKPDEMALSYVDYLNETKAYLELQMKLRKRIMIWYGGPFVLLLNVFFLGLLLENPDDTTSVFAMCGYAILMGVVVYWLNVRSANKYIAPKLEKVNELISSMEN